MREKEGKPEMRKNRKDNTKKERIIMIASSAFVLTALTLTGVYMQSKDQESENDGYTIDFSALENNVDDKSQEILDNSFGGSNILDGNNLLDNLEDDLDYMPMEAGSNLVEIPGLTDGKDKADNSKTSDSSKVKEQPSASGTTALVEEPESGPEVTEESTESAEEEYSAGGGQETLGDEVIVTQELHFAESSGLLQPLAGSLNVLIPFSRDSGVYFETLDQYKRSYAMIFAADEGTSVTACATGKVVNIFQNEEIGHALTMELGDGYQITYGQLRDIQVPLGSYVNAGDAFASVAEPTKYYIREGSNLYLQLTADGTAIDPSTLF